MSTVLLAAAPSDALALPTGPRESPVLRRLVLALLVLGFYYNWYRYPFQINSADTSPTYSDTPLWLSLGKYGLLLLLLGALLLHRLTRRVELRLSHALYPVVFAALAIVPLLTGALTGESVLPQTGFLFLVPLVLLGFRGWRVPHEAINRLLAATVVIALVVDLVQVALFLTVGRLPALAHIESISIRFGSFLDDPNGFAVLIAWLLPFTWYHQRGARRAVLCVLLGVALLLTQSLTGWIANAAVGSFFLGLAVLSRARTLYHALAALTGAAAVAGAALVVYYDAVVEVVRRFWISKEGSIEQHAEALGVVRQISPLHALGVQPLNGTFVESGFVYLLGNFGLPYTAAWVAVMLIATAWYLRLLFSTTDREVRAFAAGGVGLLAGVLVAALNLPVTIMFPLNLFAALYVGFATAGMRVKG